MERGKFCLFAYLTTQKSLSKSTLIRGHVLLFGRSFYFIYSCHIFVYAKHKQGTQSGAIVCVSRRFVNERGVGKMKAKKYTHVCDMHL